MTPIGPLRNRTVGLRIDSDGLGHIRVSPKAGSRAASTHLLTLPAARRARPPVVTLTFDLQLPGG